MIQPDQRHHFGRRWLQNFLQKGFKYLATFENGHFYFKKTAATEVTFCAFLEKIVAIFIATSGHTASPQHSQYFFFLTAPKLHFRDVSFN